MTEYDTLRLERVARDPPGRIEDNCGTRWFDDVSRTACVITNNIPERADSISRYYPAEVIDYITEYGRRELGKTGQRLPPQLTTLVAGDGR